MSRSRRLPQFAVAALTLAVMVPSCQLASAGTPDGSAHTAAAPAVAGSSGPTSSASVSATPVPSAPAPADIDGVMGKALDALPASDGRYTVAVQDLKGQRTALYGADTGPYDTASIVKVDILAALLLDAQDHGTALTAQQKQLAAAMIRSSDNAATDELWKAIGESAGLAAANERLGLTATKPGQDGHWGLTSTTAADQMVLLEAVLGDADSPLTADSRSYLRSLMNTVVADQRWGISAADDGKGSAGTPVLKNGWLPRSATGLWDVNSIGSVEYGGHTLLVAVLSDGQPSYEKGVALVERAASTAVKAFVKAETPVVAPKA
ncbi:serine hydrolase [Streptomyces sp. NBC_01506]|uniref:serine hydrolase n=1 Tax=Streptomyces sp. NBC_01506 TaxID=2903887 RepID=UPI00386F9596